MAGGIHKSNASQKQKQYLNIHANALGQHLLSVHCTLNYVISPYEQEMEQQSYKTGKHFRDKTILQQISNFRSGLKKILIT